MLRINLCRITTILIFVLFGVAAYQQDSSKVDAKFQGLFPMVLSNVRESAEPPAQELAIERNEINDGDEKR